MGRALQADTSLFCQHAKPKVIQKPIKQVNWQDTEPKPVCSAAYATSEVRAGPHTNTASPLLPWESQSTDNSCKPAVRNATEAFFRTSTI